MRKRGKCSTLIVILLGLMERFVVSYFRSKVDDLRGTPMSVGTLEEIIDDTHAIVSTSVGSEHYVSILSFVDKDQVKNQLNGSFKFFVTDDFV